MINNSILNVSNLKIIASGVPNNGIAVISSAEGSNTTSNIVVNLAHIIGTYVTSNEYNIPYDGSNLGHVVVIIPFSMHEFIQNGFQNNYLNLFEDRIIKIKKKLMKSHVFNYSILIDMPYDMIVHGYAFTMLDKLNFKSILNMWTDFTLVNGTMHTTNKMDL